jgi:hypothetical protein
MLDGKQHLLVGAGGKLFPFALHGTASRGRVPA